jgi:hypothetical protein
MGVSKITKEYRCDSDCEMLGCPNHTATLEFYSVSTTYRFDDGKGNEMWFDVNLVETMIDMFREFGEIRADTARL